MGNLLKHFPAGSYAVMMEEPDKSSIRYVPTSKLDCKYFFVRPLRLPGRLVSSRFGPILSALWEFLTVPLILFKGLRVSRIYKMDAMLVLPDSGGFELTGFLLHIITGIPIFVYFFDMYYAPGRLDSVRLFVARILEKLLFLAASSVFVMSEPLQEHYQQKYGVQPVMLPHPVDLTLYNNQKERLKEESKSHYYKIVFTGMIYQAQIDAIRNVAQAVNSLTEADVKLALYTPVSPNKLAGLGIDGPKVEYYFIPHHEIPGVQMSADILLLPLAFDAPYPDIIRTASPSKMPEYLAAGRPILVHAPSYSYISRYAREHGFGLVVDKPDINVLKEAIMRLLSDQKLRSRLVENARDTAKKNHDAEKVSKKLQLYLRKS